MARKLYVGNLPYEVGEADLQQLFGAAGTVETVNVMRDMATGRARGFGFVEMATDEEAQAAIQATNGQEFGGRALTVNEARPQEARSGFSSDSSPKRSSFSIIFLAAPCGSRARRRKSATVRLDSSSFGPNNFGANLTSSIDGRLDG